MAQFKYVAVDKTGKRRTGELEAGSVSELMDQLADMGLQCMEYRDLVKKEQAKTTYRMRLQELVVFCRQVETMLSAGVTISRVFQILTERALHAKMARLCRNIYESIQTGQTLSGAMKDQGKSFPPLLIHMVASGEASGALDRVMKRMSTHFSNDLKLVQRMRTAMIYPIILLLVSLAVVIILFTTVLPKLFGMFQGGDLPAITRFLLAFSNLLTTRWPYLIAGAVALVVLLGAAGRTERGRYFYDSMKLKVPRIGKLLRVVYTARFANSMATLYASGIPMIQSLDISCEILGNSYYTKQFQGILEGVGSGETLAEAAQNTTLFDQMFLTLVFIGEESGTLEQVLNQAAEYYDGEAQVALERMVAIMEPAMIVVLAIIIGVVVAGTILPLYGMYGNIT